MSSRRKRSKNHHYVPKGVLRQFCQSNDTILRIDKSEPRNVQKRNIDKTFQRFHLNSTTSADGEKDDNLEIFFAHELDNYIPEWIKVFEEALGCAQIKFPSRNSRRRFIQFFYNHMRRSPDFLDPLIERVGKDLLTEELAASFERDVRPLTDDERKKFADESWRSRMIANSRVSSFSNQSTEILDCLASMTLLVATPLNERKQFIVASNPVVRFESYPYQSLGDDGVELWTTLTPRIAAGFVHNSSPETALTLSDDGVRVMNRELTRQSSSIAGMSEKLLLSLANSAW